MYALLLTVVTNLQLAKAPNVTGFAKRGLICTIISIEKSRFEILFTVYLKNA